MQAQALPPLVVEPLHLLLRRQPLRRLLLEAALPARRWPASRRPTRLTEAVSWKLWATRLPRRLQASLPTVLVLQLEVRPEALRPGSSTCCLRLLCRRDTGRSSCFCNSNSNSSSSEAASRLWRMQRLLLQASTRRSTQAAPALLLLALALLLVALLLVLALPDGRIADGYPGRLVRFSQAGSRRRANARQATAAVVVLLPRPMETVMLTVTRLWAAPLQHLQLAVPLGRRGEAAAAHMQQTQVLQPLSVFTLQQQAVV